MTNLLFVSYSSKISSNRVNVALPYVGSDFVQFHLKAVGCGIAS
ncbi:Uncharacterised protein [Streptococcus pneumoniae]|nr:Uncharacterised protein [Streptococcus pneumoniae]